MGYKLIASNSAATGVTDNEWEDILALASEQGVSVQQLRLDERNDRTDIAGADAYALYEALGYLYPA